MRLRDVRSRRLAGGILFVLLGVAFLLDSLGVWTFDLVYVWPLTLIVLGAQALIGHARRKQVEEDRTATLAVAEERVRIARELHDIVAHGVSLMTIQIAAARRVAKKDPQEADKALAAAEEAGRQSLNELRGLVSVLRSADASLEEASDPADAGLRVPEPAPLTPMPRLGDLDDLIDGFRQAGLDVRLEVAGVPPAAVPASIALAAYRVVQESLTNVLRHAGSSTARVSLSHRPTEIVVVVEDDGGKAGSGSPAGGSGHGVMGMRERVAAVGGRLTAGPAGRGWRVEAVLPLGAAAVGASA